MCGPRVLAAIDDRVVERLPCHLVEDQQICRRLPLLLAASVAACRRRCAITLTLATPGNRAVHKFAGSLFQSACIHVCERVLVDKAHTTVHLCPFASATRVRIKETERRTQPCAPSGFVMRRPLKHVRPIVETLRWRRRMHAGPILSFESRRPSPGGRSDLDPATAPPSPAHMLLHRWPACQQLHAQTPRYLSRTIAHIPEAFSQMQWLAHADTHVCMHAHTHPRTHAINTCARTS